MLIIGIAGGTGSGKTTVVRKIVESLPEASVAVIPQDSYYNDQSDLPLNVRKQTNFDHPDAFEWPLLAQQIEDLKAGRAIEQPTYSYITCTRLPETVHVEPRDVIIVEGIRNDRSRQQWWTSLHGSQATGTSYDLGDIGLLALDPSRHAQAYWGKVRKR